MVGGPSFETCSVVGMRTILNGAYRTLDGARLAPQIAIIAACLHEEERGEKSRTVGRRHDKRRKARRDARGITRASSMDEQVRTKPDVLHGPAVVERDELAEAIESVVVLRAASCAFAVCYAEHRCVACPFASLL